MFFKKDTINSNEEIFVAQPIDTLFIEKNIKKNIMEPEKVIVAIKDNTNTIKAALKYSKTKVKKEEKKEADIFVIAEKQIVVAVEKEFKVVNTSNVKLPEVAIPKIEMPNKRIVINSDDLLYAVTHTEDEVKEYYAKYNINRREVLDTIDKQLIKSNLKIDANTILVEIERDINEEDFKQNFMQKFKLKLSDFIVAIADRNK